MTPIEAYEIALEKVDELKQSGIQVKITPSTQRNDKKIIKQFSGAERIPPDKWIKVEFGELSEDQCEKIKEAANYLGMAGMRFDTSGHKKLRDWDLDWSFIYTGEEDEEWREGREWVEDEIEKLPNSDEDE